MNRLILLCGLVCSIFASSLGFRFRTSALRAPDTFSSTSLFAHHPQKKIIKRKMDRRPKKHRLSDINRTNSNLGKCITKVLNAPPEYTIISAEDYMK
eukprot:gene53194-72661_t